MALEELRSARQLTQTDMAEIYAFDPRRAAMLLIGGAKTGSNRWYEEYVPLADAIYDRHLRELGDGE
jgi:hypothetical protein